MVLTKPAFLCDQVSYSSSSSSSMLVIVQQAMTAANTREPNSLVAAC
jgi:hypothetical protein